MANGIQRAIYNLANAVPLAIMTALVWYLEFKTWRIPGILLAVAIVVTILFAFAMGRITAQLKALMCQKLFQKTRGW